METSDSSQHKSLLLYIQEAGTAGYSEYLNSAQQTITNYQSIKSAKENQIFPIWSCTTVLDKIHKADN